MLFLALFRNPSIHLYDPRGGYFRDNIFISISSDGFIISVFGTGYADLDIVYNCIWRHFLSPGWKGLVVVVAIVVIVVVVVFFFRRCPYELCPYSTMRLFQGQTP